LGYIRAFSKLKAGICCWYWEVLIIWTKK